MLNCGSSGGRKRRGAPTRQSCSLRTNSSDFVGSEVQLVLLVLVRSSSTTSTVSVVLVVANTSQHEYTCSTGSTGTGNGTSVSTVFGTSYCYLASTSSTAANSQLVRGTT